MDDDVQAGCFLLSVYGVIFGVVVGAILIGSLIWYLAYYKPLADNAFNSEVQGLVTEYCTAPRQDDELAARSQLSNLVAGKPDQFHNLPSELKQKAQAVVNNDINGACV